MMADKNIYIFDNSFAPTRDITVPCCGLNSTDLPSQQRNISPAMSQEDLYWYPNISPALSTVTIPVHNPLELSPAIGLQQDYDCELPTGPCSPLGQLLSSHRQYSLKSKPKSFIELKTSLSNLNNYLKERYANFTSRKSCNLLSSSSLHASEANAQKNANCNKLPGHENSCANKKIFSQDIKSLSCQHSNRCCCGASHHIQESAKKGNQKKRTTKRLGKNAITEDSYASEYHPTHEENSTSLIYVILPYLVMGSALLVLML